nr:hypothetical protein GCM10020092_008010 [Actinoplanes digitatis]
MDATAGADATVLTLRVSTGCRPQAPGVDLAPSPPAAVETPPAFGAALGALGAGGAGVTASEVACPGGGTARTVTADGLTAPADLGRALRVVTGGTAVVQADPHVLAYRDGAVSVVVSDSDGKARVTATTGCR